MGTDLSHPLQAIPFLSLQVFFSQHADIQIDPTEVTKFLLPVQSTTKTNQPDKNEAYFLQEPQLSTSPNKL